MLACAKTEDQGLPLGRSPHDLAPDDVDGHLFEETTKYFTMNFAVFLSVGR